MSQTDSDRFWRELLGLRWRLWLQRIAGGSRRGLVLGTTLLLVSEPIARLARISPQWSQLLAFGPLLGVCACGAWCLVWRPTLVEAARLTDRRLRQREQLGTALELLDANQRTPFALAQVARAGLAAEQGRRQSPQPVGRWSASVAAYLLVSAAMGYVVLASGQWLDALPFPSYSAGGGTESDTQLTASEAVLTSEANSQSLLGSLQQIMQAVNGDQPPSAEQLAATEQALADKTAASRSAQQALSTLANALQQVSAGQASADALSNGDYAAAVADIAQLGLNSDQLSPQARKLLSNALLNASAASKDSPAVADRERRAAESLKYASYGPTNAALQALAESVNKTSQSILSQEQLSAAWQQLQAAEQRAQAASLGEPPPGGTPQSARLGDSGAEARAAVGGPAAQADKGAAGSGNASSGFEPDATQTRLNVAGVPVEVPLQLSVGPSRQLPAVPGEQAPGEVSVVSDQATVSADAGASGQLRVARAERNAVPADMRPVVREYFGEGTPSP